MVSRVVVDTIVPSRLDTKCIVRHAALHRHTQYYILTTTVSTVRISWAMTCWNKWNQVSTKLKYGASCLEKTAL